MLYFSSIEKALLALSKITDHAFVSGGGEIYKALIEHADTLHISTIHKEIDGDIFFPNIQMDIMLCLSKIFIQI